MYTTNLLTEVDLEQMSYDQAFYSGNQALAEKNYTLACTCYRKALRNNDNLAPAHLNLATALIEMKDLNTALHHVQKALQIQPIYARAHYQHGRILEQKDKKQEALQAYHQAYKLDPTYFECVVALAHLLRDQNNFKEAALYYKKALEIKPRTLTIMLDLANALNTDNQTEKALTWYFKILELVPDNPSILYNIAYTYKKLNRLVDAMPYYRKVLTLQPNHVEAHFSYSLALLLTGNQEKNNWQKGWQEYEWRWKRDQSQALRNYPQPLWDGSDLHNKILFLWAEQGLGDTFQFIRYAKVAKDLGARKVIVAVQRPLLAIIAELPYIDQLIAIDQQPPYFDYHAPLLSMPYLTKTTLENTPDEIPYLHIDNNLVEKWKAILNDDHNFKIGICWQGNPNYATQFLRAAVAAKSMRLTEFLPLMHMQGVTVYSLQKTTGTDQLDDLPLDTPFVIFDEAFDTQEGRFKDTAALIKNLDLVITIDTSICHLAAGLGVPTWNLLPNPPDWRWMLDCDNTPWFPNMRLFRQPTPGDWKSVMQKVITELTAHLYQKKPLIIHEKPY